MPEGPSTVCPYCGSKLHGSARVVHVKRCATKTPEEREYYKKHRQWRVECVDARGIR